MGSLPVHGAIPWIGTAGVAERPEGQPTQRVPCDAGVIGTVIGVVIGNR